MSDNRSSGAGCLAVLAAIVTFPPFVFVAAYVRGGVLADNWTLILGGCNDALS